MPSTEKLDIDALAKRVSKSMRPFFVTPYGELPLQEIVVALKEETGASAVSIFLESEKGDVLSNAAYVGYIPEYSKHTYPIDRQHFQDALTSYVHVRGLAINATREVLEKSNLPFSANCDLYIEEATSSREDEEDAADAEPATEMSRLIAVPIVPADVETNLPTNEEPGYAGFRNAVQLEGRSFGVLKLEGVGPVLQTNDNESGTEDAPPEDVPDEAFTSEIYFVARMVARLLALSIYQKSFTDLLQHGQDILHQKSFSNARSHLDAVLKQMLESLQAKAAAVFSLSPEEKNLQVYAAVGFRPDASWSSYSRSPSRPHKSVLADTTSRRRYHPLGKLGLDKRRGDPFLTHCKSNFNGDVANILCWPLIDDSNYPRGVFVVVNRPTSTLDGVDRSACRAFADHQIAPILAALSPNANAPSEARKILEREIPAKKMESLTIPERVQMLEKVRPSLKVTVADCAEYLDISTPYYYKSRTPKANTKKRASRPQAVDHKGLS